VLTRRALKRLADPRSFSRGEAYAAEDRVRALVVYGGAIRATVAGSEDYRVKLSVEQGSLAYSCDCPIGTDGVLCKHCVAVGLVWLRESKRKGAGADPAHTTAAVGSVQTFLQRKSAIELTGLLLEHAAEDERLMQKLEIAALRASPGGIDTRGLKRAIAAAGRVGANAYESARPFANRMRLATEPLEEMIATGNAAPAVELAEVALAAIERALSRVDDSNGIIGELLRELAELHHRACVAARPDPKATAKRLFAWELQSGWDTFRGAAETYADVLGESGLATYRALANKEWAKVRAVGPGDDDEDRYAGRFRIASIMEALARLTGDVEEIVAVKSRTLAMPYGFLQIAEAYRAAEKHDAALEWAERGMRAFQPRADVRLAVFIGDEYTRRRRFDDALAAVWPHFEERPRLDTYARLKAYGEAAGTWPTVRARAQTVLTSIAGRNSTLVEILLWEGRIDEAWRAALRHDCTTNYWYQLAELRAADHPDDAIVAYTRVIAETAARTNNRACADVVALLRAIEAVLRRHRRVTEFSKHVAAVRRSYGAKRNLMKLLADAGW
jgi:uncharacterized Zn finger protein